MVCSKCGDPLASDAQFCSKCGTAIGKSPDNAAPHTAKNQSCGSAILLMGGLLFAAFVLMIVVGMMRESRDVAYEPDIYIAQASCENYVSRELRSPSTATFPKGRETQRTDLGDGEYRIESYVDSQNGFGAIVRSNYNCQVRYVGDEKWQLLDLQFDP